MAKCINKIIEESLQEEVNVDKEWERLYKVILQKHSMHPVYNKKRKFFLYSLKYAIAILIGFFLSATFFYLAYKEYYDLNSSYKIVTEKGERSFLQLPDGSKVWLNACTTLEYGTDYGITNRKINLIGEAYFEVAKNKRIPFIVKTNEVEVKALGTTFNICAYEDDSKLTTALFNGKVAIQSFPIEQQVFLNPNQVAIYHKKESKIETMPYNKQMFAQWKEGGLSFERMYLEEIAKSLQRNYNVVFLFKNQQIKELRFSGHFNENESLSEILRVIKTNTSINYQIVKDTIIIN